MIKDACKCPLEIAFYYLNGPTPGSLNSHYQVNDVTQTLESKRVDIYYTMFFKRKKTCFVEIKKITVNDRKLLKLTFMAYKLYSTKHITRKEIS